MHEDTQCPFNYPLGSNIFVYMTVIVIYTYIVLLYLHVSTDVEWSVTLIILQD